MPFVRIRLHGALDGTAERLARAATDAMAGAMGKVRGLTAVEVDTGAAGLWTVGGEPQAAAAHVDAYVTAGTNDAGQKARFVAAMAAALKEAVPGLPLATYVVIHELPADGWGYDGLTQAARRPAG